VDTEQRSGRYTVLVAAEPVGLVRREPQSPRPLKASEVRNLNSERAQKNPMPPQPSTWAWAKPMRPVKIVLLVIVKLATNFDPPGASKS